jgi:hypothetical protein
MPNDPLNRRETEAPSYRRPSLGHATSAVLCFWGSCVAPAAELPAETLGPIYRLQPVVCQSVRLAPRFTSSVLAGLSPRRMRRPDMWLRLRRSDFRSGVFHNSCRKMISGGLLDRNSCVFRGRPNLKLLEQGIGCRLADFGLSPVASFTKQCNFVARQGCR